MKKHLVVFALIFVMTQRLFAQVVVDPSVTKALQTSPVAEVIVTFYGDGSPTANQLSLMQQVGITKAITLRALPIAGMVATSAQVSALAQRPEVKSIFLNKQLTYYNFDATQLTGVRRLRADRGFTARNNGLPVSGKGISVLVNDSGVDGTHDDLKFGPHLVQNVLGSTNLNAYDSMLPITFVEGVPNTDSNSGHGTHCAGSVGGTGARSGGKYEGVAPGASLIGYGSGAALFVLDAIGGFDYALTHQFQYNIRVISNSFGTSGDFDPTDPLNVATKKCYDRGMVVVFAAGNEGPGADTHNPYGVAPWVISVGAGDKNGKLAGFSSRGVKGEQGTFMVDGETWTFKNEPVIVGPGVDIISTRAIAPVSSLGADADAATIAPGQLPFYTTSSGTSMSTPHVAGVIALMLEAKPSLSPAEVRQIIEKTATNMPGRESWEVGAGYVNAYAAVDHVFRSAVFGSTVNSTRTFTSSVNSRATVQPFSVNFSPASTTGNQFTFPVSAGTNSLEAKIISGGVSGETGNPLTLVLIDPAGVRYRAGIPVAFTLFQDRSVAVASPKAGTWTLRVEGLNGVAIPERVSGNITQQTVSGTTGLNDIVNHPAEASIKMAIDNRLVDGINGSFKPNDALKRIQLADYMLMGQAIRQYYPTDGSRTYSDVSGNDILLAESVSARGAAQRDGQHQFKGVMLPVNGKFAPSASVDRVTLAYALVQGLGFQPFAEERNGKPVSVLVDGKRIPIDDASTIPAGMEGYVSLALDLNLINAFYTLTQGTFDLTPTLHATFKPKQTVTRAEFAVIVTRTFTQWEGATPPPAQARVANEVITVETGAYPNPFSGSTTISYTLPQADFVTIDVNDISGRPLKTLVNEQKSAGKHEVRFDGGSLPSGVYMFNVKTGTTITSKRLLVR